MKESRQHVVPDLHGGWSVRKSGAERASRTFGKQSDAICYARETAKKSGGEVYIHRKDGTVRERDSYAGDPRPPNSKQ